MDNPRYHNLIHTYFDISPCRARDMSAAATLATLSGRSDFVAIAKWIKPNAPSARLGWRRRIAAAPPETGARVTGYGIEITMPRCSPASARGERAAQNDLESGLSGFESNSFDYVILSQTAAGGAPH